MSEEPSPACAGVRVLRRKQVLDKLKISSATLYSWIQAGCFPAPIKLGPNSRAWLESEIDDLLIQRAKERAHQPAINV
jgi:prophage regulatory protein